VHHAHAAQADLDRLTDEGGQRFARVVGAQPVQVQLALDAPFAPAQAARDVRADAGAAKAQLLVGFQQRA
jgi:hypothetical protein